MRRIAVFLLMSCALYASVISAKTPIESDILRLDLALENRSLYEAEKRLRIDSLMTILDTTDAPYFTCEKIYEEYKSYNYDTALIFVRCLQQESARLRDTTMMINANISRAFVYLSGGLFKEAYDVLSPMLPHDTYLPDEYYLVFARLLYDMADYAGGDVAEAYNEQGHRLLEQLTAHLSPQDSARYWYPLATIDLRMGNYKRSIHRFELAMQDTRATAHEKAIWSSSIAFLHRQLGDEELALRYYIDAAIYDIQASVNEAVALRMVAEILYEQGEIALADKYIHVAMLDAQHYHARFRQVSISQLLPIIERQYAQTMRQHSARAHVLLVVAVVLLLVSLLGLVLLARRTHTLHTARQTIDEINQNLFVANHVKEQLLSTLMVGHSQYLNAVERYQNDVKDSVVKRNLSALMSVPKNVDARMQRQAMNRRLDEMLLSVFPNFVENFNQLMKEDARIELRKDELLTPSLRIFGLMRLGISQNEVIAEIMDYSINTVYTYKTRTINNSIYSSEAFYEALMRIPSFAQK